MVDLNARLVEPGQGNSEALSIEHPVPFRFTVTWTSLFEAFETPKTTPALVAPINDHVRPLLAAHSEAPPDQASMLGAKKPPPSPGVQWEMVVPKMVRSTPKPVRASETASPRSGAVLQPSTEPAQQAIPNFCSATPSLSWRVRQAPLAIKLLLAGTALTALAVPVWRHYSSAKPAAAEIQTTPRAGGWARQPVTKVDAGFNRARELVVYRPSLKASDCQFEFDWKPDTSGVGWLFRATDTANYYAMRIKVLKPGPSPTLSIEHFTVYHGTEGAHSEKVLVLSRNDPVLRVRTELAGPSFTLYIGGTAAEYWTDAKLTAGGLGFFNEWHQGSDVQSVRMSFAAGTEIQRDGLRLYMNAPGGGY
jgi:hypothetical protein